jgi:hypothetical protein
MIISWMLFASTGILIARYFKFMLPNFKLCNLDFWFILHRPIMISVTIISVLGFISILWHSNWQWVSLSNSVIVFVHSIFGIVTICLSIVQVRL